MQYLVHSNVEAVNMIARDFITPDLINYFRFESSNRMAIDSLQNSFQIIFREGLVIDMKGKSKLRKSITKFFFILISFLAYPEFLTFK